MKVVFNPFSGNLDFSGQDPASGTIVLQGSWNAATNSPALTSGVGTAGNAYIVSVAGSTNLDGTTQWNIGDWVVFDGTIWTKLAGGVNSSTATSTAVASVAALRLLPVVVGAVVTLLGYYTAGDAPARSMYGVANASPVDDGGMAFNGPTGNQWVSEAPNNGEINVLWWGAVRGINTVPATDSSPAFTAAIAWVQAGSLVNGPNRPMRIFAPVGIYRLNSSLDFGRSSLVGEGGYGVNNINTHTQFFWYGEGFAISGRQADVYENFYIWGKDATKFQCGFNVQAGVQGSIKNIQVYDMTGIGIQLYLSSVGAPLLCQIENIGAVNQGSVRGKVGIRSGASTLYNANANLYHNAFSKGKWQTLYMIGGNGSKFLVGDCEPVNDTTTTVRQWYWFGGNANEVSVPYIEPSYPVLPSAAQEAKYRPIKFAGYWRVIEFVAVPTAGDTLTLNGTTITFVASGATGNQCNIGASIQETLQNLDDMINASVDANLSKLNAFALWREILVDENVAGGVTNFTVTCVSANSAFRVPVGGIPFNALWPISSGNSIKGTNWATYLYANTVAHIQDLGSSNDVVVSRINNISPSPIGENFSTANLAPNSEFLNMYLDSARANLPVPSGYSVTQYSGGVVMTRVSTPTPDGRGYALQVDVPVGGRFEIRFIPVYANLSTFGNGPLAYPLNMLLNKTVICGVWIKSSVKNLGATVFIPGSSARVGDASHDGSGEWRQMLMTGRILPSVAAPQTIALIIANKFNLTAAPVGEDGTFYISQPVFMLGNRAPQTSQPMLLNDFDTAVTGKLTLNAPQSLLSSAGANNSTTPSVAEFNTFTEAYTTPVNVTQFLGGRAGQEITIFTTTANITFVHNGAATANTIYTSTAGNVVSVANRIYKFVSNGTKWYQM